MVSRRIELLLLRVRRQALLYTKGVGLGQVLPAGSCLVGALAGGRACGPAASGRHSRWAPAVSGDLTALLCLMGHQAERPSGVYSVSNFIEEEMISDALGKFGFLSPLFNVFTGLVYTADVTVNSV